MGPCSNTIVKQDPLTKLFGIPHACRQSTPYKGSHRARYDLRNEAVGRAARQVQHFNIPFSVRVVDACALSPAAGSAHRPSRRGVTLPGRPSSSEGHTFACTSHHSKRNRDNARCSYVHAWRTSLCTSARRIGEQYMAKTQRHGMMRSVLPGAQDDVACGFCTCRMRR